MKKIKYILYIIALSLIGIQTTHGATFDVSGSILDSKNENVDNIKINFVNKTTNKNDCELKVKQGSLSGKCDFETQDLHRTYDIIFSNYNTIGETYKTSIRGSINKNTITVGNDITNNISIKLNVDDKGMRTTQVIKASQPLEEKTATLEIKGVNKNIILSINGQEVNYSPNTKHTIKSKDKRLEIKIPEYEVKQVMELVNRRELNIDISQIVKQKEEKADLIFHSRDISQLHSDLQKESIQLTGNGDMDQKYRIDLKAEQIIHEGDKTIAKDICILDYCPKFIPYNQTVYALDSEKAQYIEIKELNKRAEESQKQEDNNAENKTNIIFITIFVGALITIVTTLFFLIKLIRKKREE